MPGLEHGLSAPPFTEGLFGSYISLPEIRRYGVIPGSNGELINFAEVEPDYMPLGELALRVGDWVYVSGVLSDKTKGGKSTQAVYVQNFVDQETEVKSFRKSGRFSLRAHPEQVQLVLKLMPESYRPKLKPYDQA